MPAADTILRLEVRPLTLELVHRHVGSTSPEAVLQTLPPPTHSNTHVHVHARLDRAAARRPEHSATYTMRLLWVSSSTSQASAEVRPGRRECFSREPLDAGSAPTRFRGVGPSQPARPCLHSCASPRPF